MSHHSLLEDERGIGTTEYIILIVLIAIAGWAAWSEFGEAVSEKIAPTSSIEASSDPLA